MFGMLGSKIVELEVHKTTRQLNQPLVEIKVGSLATIHEPEMLQHIMSFVIVLVIEAFKISQVARMVDRALFHAQPLDESLDPI